MNNSEYIDKKIKAADHEAKFFGELKELMKQLYFHHKSQSVEGTPVVSPLYHAELAEKMSKFLFDKIE